MVSAIRAGAGAEVAAGAGGVHRSSLIRWLALSMRHRLRCSAATMWEAHRPEVRGVW